MDPLRHRQFTGSDNARILENLRWASAACAQGGTELWVRTPLIPGATALAENLHAIGAFLAALPGPVARWELCAFNNLCRDKYRRLDLQWDYAHTPLLTRAGLDAFAAAARSSGIDASIVHATGPLAKG
jgi:pyruvate formate lyase activating enzyme